VHAEQRTDPIAHHAEGPVWSPRWGGLRWVDMLAGDVLSLGADGTVQRRHVSFVVAALRPRVGGGAVIGVERGFALEAPDGTITHLDPVWEDPTLRMNEGACDPEGRFYCGSMAYDKRPGAGALHRLDPDGSVRLVLTGVTISNGLDWSPDGSLAFYNDTDTYRIDVFDHSPESGLTRRRTFAELASDEGRPDGLTVDAEGGVWVALNGTGTVRRYRADGVIDEVVEVPVAKVTACTLGGARLDELFITTSREGLQPGDDPLAGSLFSVRVGVGGQRTREFHG
jgi:sugar lactone lactonase YvrE